MSAAEKNRNLVQTQEQDEHYPRVVDDQESPYWFIICACGWRSGVATHLDAVVDLYGTHRANLARPTTGEPEA